MLRNNFFNVQDMEKQADSLSARFAIDAAHPIFKGHFPNQPVVPGVCMVQIIKELLEEALGEKLMMKEAAQIKFLQLLVPEDNARLSAEVNWQNSEKGIETVASLKNEEKTFFKMNAVFQKQ